MKALTIILAVFAVILLTVTVTVASLGCNLSDIVTTYEGWQQERRANNIYSDLRERVIQADRENTEAAINMNVHPVSDAVKQRCSDIITAWLHDGAYSDYTEFLIASINDRELWLSHDEIRVFTHDRRDVGQTISEFVRYRYGLEQNEVTAYCIFEFSYEGSVYQTFMYIP